jgi:hypothetical protein
MAAARIRAAEELDARHILQDLVERMAWRLLDLPSADALYLIDALGLRLGECPPRDDNRSLRRI